MKRLLASLLLVSGLAVAAMPKSDPVAAAKAWTVIVTNEGFMDSGRGTGVLLDETHVLTCRHMISGPKDELFVYTYPLGQVIKAHAENISQSEDLAILVLESSAPVKHFPVFQVNYTDGEPILVLGNALGSMKWFVTRGVISGTDHGDVLTDALVNPGNSGGPWINAAGEIVAITDWRIGPSESKHYPGLAGGISARAIGNFILETRQRSFLDKILESLRPE